jgi:hypothetical protein
LIRHSMGTMLLCSAKCFCIWFFLLVQALSSSTCCVHFHMCRSKGFAFIGFTCKADAEKVSSRHVSLLFHNWVFVISTIGLLN